MIENGVYHRLLRYPRMEPIEVQTLRELADHAVHRSRFARRCQRRLHEIEMSMRHLAPQLFEPRGSRQHDISESTSRLIEKQVITHDQRSSLESRGHCRSVRIR